MALTYRLGRCYGGGMLQTSPILSALGSRSWRWRGKRPKVEELRAVDVRGDAVLLRPVELFRNRGVCPAGSVLGRPHHQFDGRGRVVAVKLHDPEGQDSWTFRADDVLLVLHQPLDAGPTDCEPHDAATLAGIMIKVDQTVGIRWEHEDLGLTDTELAVLADHHVTRAANVVLDEGD